MARATVEVTTDLVTITCYRGDCGILFAVPELWDRSRRRDHTSFYCPNGHSQAFLGKTREEELAEKLAGAVRERDRLRKERARLSDDVMDLTRSVRAHKGVATKLRRKAARGQCGFCEQHFPDVESHVREVHPDELAAVDRERVEDAGEDGDGDG